MSIKENHNQSVPKNLMLIINPVAGKETAKKNLADIVEAFADSEYFVTVFVTKAKGDAIKYVSEYGYRFDLIVCCGGDGTMSELINGLIKADLDIPLGYIPAGSFNDFATYNNLSFDPAKAAKNIANGKCTAVDIIDFNGNYFINASEFGAFTRVSYSTPQKQKNLLGNAAYLLEGIKDIGNITAKHMKVYANGEIIEGDYIFGILCNATKLANILRKKGKLIQEDDGIMEFGLIHMPSNPLDMQEILQALYKNDLSDPHITFFKSKEMTIETPENTNWSVDGELVITPNKFNVKVLHHRIKLLT